MARAETSERRGLIQRGVQEGGTKGESERNESDKIVCER